MGAKTIVKEKETGADAVRWDLSDLFQGIEDPKIEKTLETCLNQSKKFAKKYKGTLKKLDSGELKSAFDELEEIKSKLYKVSQFVHLVYSTNTASDPVKILISKVDDISSKISNELVFFSLELGKLPTKLIRNHQKSGQLKSLTYNLDRVIETAKYDLSEKEEKLINLKDLSGVDAHQKLYTDLTSSFQFEMEVDGKLKKMNGAELRALRLHPDRSTRQNAMKLFFNRYEDYAIVLTQLYNSVVKDYETERSMRGYQSPVNRMNVHNDLPDAAVEALHEVTTQAYKLVQRYYKLKAKLVQIPDMTLADIYAPLPKSNKTYTYNEAKDLVLSSFSKFDETFYQYAKLMFDENRIDAPPGAGKQGGAYCSSSTPDVKPYVLLNFLGKPRDVATMAHELGHAIHDIFCEKQPLFNYHPILPLAETASVFSEMILTDQLLSQETSKEGKIEILTDKLEDIFATSHRQNMFSRFEHAAHNQISTEFMTTGALCDLYENELKLMFGGSVSVTPEYRWEWSAIPHIYQVPFYVYAYNFGNLLVMALFEQYQEEGKSFIPSLKQILSMGSSASPIDITKIANVDITKLEFWQKSIQMISRMLDELASLLEDK